MGGYFISNINFTVSSMYSLSKFRIFRDLKIGLMFAAKSAILVALCKLHTIDYVGRMSTYRSGGTL